MKTSITVLSLLLLLAFVPSASAQKVNIKKGDYFYELFQFDKAIGFYKKQLAKKPDDYATIRKVADCYRHKHDYPEAESWYAQAIKNPAADSLTYLYYADALKNNGKYEEAKAAYKNYAAKAPNDQKATSLEASVDDIASLKKDSLTHIVNLVPVINSPNSDFSPAFYQDSLLVFPSARNSKKKKDVWLEQPFFDLYLAEKSDLGFKEPTKLVGKINKRYHQGPVAFAGDSVMYFTRNFYKRILMKKGDDETMKQIIVKATKDDKGRWCKLDYLKGLNSRDYAVEHPTLSPDGKRMYFASDMPGGIGGFDLYVVDMGADGKWGKPQNLGPGINTTGNEGFPFLKGTDTLFFASNAYNGLGGLDIYMATLAGSKWGGVTNMGYPINTSYDDFGLIMDKKGTSGYFSSNRVGGPGSDDIYSFDAGIELNVVVYDQETGKNIGQASINLIYGHDSSGTKLTDDEGKYKFYVAKGKTYQLPTSKKGYLPNSLLVNMDTITPTTVVRIPLTPEKLLLDGIVYRVKVDPETKIESRVGTMQGAVVKLQNLTTGKMDSVLSDDKGAFKFVLQPECEYKLTGEKDLFFLKSEVTLNTLGKTNETLHAELELYKFEGIIRLANIYYDFDKYDIRPDAAKELDRLYAYLVKYPDMEIELSSHTDCRGNTAYNATLSTRRAQSAVNYLLNKGKADHFDLKKNLVAKGYGETRPIYPGLCKTDQGEQDDKLTPDEIAKHQMNRRTEFAVTKQPKAIKVEGSIAKPTE